MTINNISDSERSAVQLLQEINSGVLDAKILDKSSRQRCIELLIAEGYTYPQINQILRISEKTIGRDIKEIRTRNEMTPNVEFAKQFIGEVFQKAMSHHGFLVRLARGKETSSAEKIQSEYAAWKILKELVEKFQTLGYLPLKPQEIAGDLYHHVAMEEGSESIVEVKKMLLEIEDVAKDTGTHSPELAEQIKMLKARVDEAEVVSEIKKLKDKQQKQILDKDDNENDK